MNDFYQVNFFEYLVIQAGYYAAYALLLMVTVLFVLAVYSWLRHAYRFTKLILDADKFHGNVIKDRYKNKRFKLIFRILFHEAIKCALMGRMDSMSSNYWYYSNKECYVKGK